MPRTKKLTKTDLITRLNSIRELHGYDPERAHSEADGALLEFINDPTVTEAFDAIKKWYA
jgi:hypothetical protein